jgi:hypothetical protein
MTTLIVLAITGFVAAVINAVAGNGGTLVVTVMSAIGLPANSITASVRIPSLLGYLTTGTGFMRQKVVPWGLTLRLAAPLAIGAGVGALVASITPELITRYAVIVGLSAGALVLYVSRTGWTTAGMGMMSVNARGRTLAIFFAVGAWSGFIFTASTMYALLVLVLVAHLEIVPANAVKAVAVFGENLFAAAVFLGHGDIHWDWVIALSAGFVAGGLLGVWVALRYSKPGWIHDLLLFMTLAGLLVAIARVLPA